VFASAALGLFGAAGACVGTDRVARGPAPAVVVEGLPPAPPAPRLPLVGPAEPGFQVALPSPNRGDVSGLARVLGRHEAVEVVAAESPRLRDAARRLLDSLPTDETAAVEFRWSSATGLVDAELVSSLQPPDGPRGAVSLDWRGDVAASGVPTLFVIPRAPTDSFVVSACESTLAAWGEAQRHAVVRLQPYLDHVDASLLHFYRRELRQRAPQGPWQVEAKRGAGKMAACVRSWADAVESERACAFDDADECRFAPHVHLVEELRVGVPSNPVWRDAACTETLGFDPRAELLDVARLAAEATGEATSSAWAEQAQRVALLGELGAILEDACAPAPRVEDDAARQRLERRLRAIGSAYAAAPSLVEGTRWQLDDDEYSLATGETMEQVSRVTVAPDSPADHMAALLASLREDVAAVTACGRDEWGADFFVVLVEGAHVSWVSTHPVSPDCPSSP
jgi:hypothetical protein